jgi:hypothetical protein
MKSKKLARIVALGAILASGPLLGDMNAPKLDIPFGTLLSDASCPLAKHVLLAPCPPNAPVLYVDFPQGKNVDRYVGQNVSTRGTVEFTTCTLPLLHASRIVLTDVLPDCPAP